MVNVKPTTVKDNLENKVKELRSPETLSWFFELQRNRLKAIF